MEFIQQRRKSDCGIACVAMLSDKMYGDVAALFKAMKKTTRGGLYPDDVLEVLEELGCDYSELKDLPKRGKALVAVQWKDESLSGHYIVWDSKRKQFLDPLHGVINKRDMLKLVEIEEIWKIRKEK